MNDQGECKKCGARITRSTTFCRSCDTVFPEFVEITKEGAPKDEPNKTKPPEYQGLTYSSPGYSKQEEKAEPKEPSTGKKTEEPTPKTEPQPKEPEPLEQPDEREVPKAEKTEPTPLPETQTSQGPKLDDSLRKEQNKRPKQKVSAREQVAGKKSDTGEFAIFKKPQFIQPQSGVRLIDSGKKIFSSAEVIGELATETSRSPDEVAGVLDGFWDYVADVTNHFSPSNKGHWSLIIPHFGTFRFRFNWKKGGYRPRFTFKSSTTASAKAHRRTYSSKWADQWSGDPEGLSVRRKISVYISERCGLPLRQSDMIFNRLLRTARELCEGGGRIHWTRRGTMGTFRVVDKKGVSSLNPQTGEYKTLHKGRNSITGESVPAEENEHFSFSPSKGFLQRLNLPELPKQRANGWFETSRKKDEHGQQSGCGGCSVISFLIVVGVGIWIFWFALDDEEESWETEKPHIINTQGGYDRIESETLKVFTSTRRNTPAPKSVRTGIKIVIEFSNQLDFPVNVHWINFDGKRRSYFPLDPQEEIKWGTYAGHTWLVTDMQGKALMFFIATKLKNRTHGLATITSENLPNE